ncbi:MAG: succinate dehydrogenase/fumarate reductase cytochrome b subunit [Rikenellaceae bacterium]|nr:succinate dehydrogenase/fumarate reductase cytochrome b subunit [Rikenellaceae bacterium]
MSITGTALVLFLLFHMAMNLAAVFSAEAYNWICALLGANWYALLGTMGLGALVGIHFIYAFWLSWQNFRARGMQRYAQKKSPGVSWASRNMLVLGIIVCCGLLVHLFNFWAKMQLVEVLGHHENSLGFAAVDGYSLIERLFSNPLYCVVYLVWFAALWFHMTHGIWSAIQTIGWNNEAWKGRIKAISHILATLIFLGFATVVVFFYLKSLGLF